MLGGVIFAIEMAENANGYKNCTWTAVFNRQMYGAYEWANKRENTKDIDGPRGVWFSGNSIDAFCAYNLLITVIRHVGIIIGGMSICGCGKKMDRSFDRSIEISGHIFAKIDPKSTFNSE